tara:strand:+ start:146 stop:718 length:573 start_codon:yes stop_codon:yes gene_type:complete
MKKYKMILGLWVCGLVMFNGCATTERQGVTVNKEDEMPVWINDPRSGLEEATIAGVGSDQAADADVESSKQAAEAIASEKVAQELEKKIVSMFEKQIIRKKAGKKVQFSERINSSIKQLVAKKMVGVRYQEYYYLNADGKPDRINPKTIYVRAVLDAENKALAEDLGAIEEEAAEDLFAPDAAAEAPSEG